jgi:hypothetical protein
MRTATSIAALLLAALAFAACGGSEGESEGQSEGQSGQANAESTVCDARASIGKQVDALKATTPSTFTVADVTKRLNTIRGDLQSIKGARKDLSDDRRAQVDSANQAFESEVKDVSKQLLTSLSSQDAKAEVTASLQQLGTTYQKTYARVDCS